MFVTNTHWPDPPRANLSNTFVFAFDALRLPLRFVLTLAFWKAGGAQFAVELDFNKAGMVPNTKLCFYSNRSLLLFQKCSYKPMMGVSSLFFGEMGCVALCLLKIQWKLLV